MKPKDREIIYNVKKEKGQSINELKRLMNKWQSKLEMNNWDLSLKIVEFRRKNNYRQSGDFIANVKNKKATILMTNNPWRGDEEYTLVHEMLHVLIYDFDKYCENILLKKFKKNGKEHDKYMDKLEKSVHQLTKIILGRSDR